MKISVIIPVYGVAQYIESCTQSLLNQTMVDDIEFLYVDDHGPDNSIELVQQMIENHPRKSQFRFLRPEHNMGAGMARNFAIPQATGEYIAFVDSDDTIDPNMFEMLYNEAHRYDVDLCCCQMQKYFPDGSTGDIMENPHVAPGKLTHDKRAYILTHYVSLFCSFLFRRTMLIDNDIHFAEERSADDSFFVSCALMIAQSIAYVDEPFYHYLMRPGSVTTTKDSNKYQKRLAVFSKLVQYAKDHNVYTEFKPEIDFIYIKKGYLSSVTNYIINSSQPRHAVYDEIYQELLRLIPDYRQNPYLKKKFSIRTLIFLIRKLPSLGTTALRLYVKKTGIIS